MPFPADGSKPVHAGTKAILQLRRQARGIYFLPPIILITQKIAAIRLFLFKNSRKIRCFCLAQFILAMMSSTCSGRSIRMQAKRFLMRKTCAMEGAIMALASLALRYQRNLRGSPNTLATFSLVHLGNGICCNTCVLPSI